MSKYFALVMLVLTVAGCNTLNGVGKDIEKAGEAVQNSSK